MDAEVAGGPDAEELEGAQGADQVAEVRLFAEVADARQPVDRGHVGRDREHREAGGERACLQQERPGPAEDDDRCRKQGGGEPDRPGETEHADESGAGRGEWQCRASAAALLERPGQKRGDQREQQRTEELLDPAPERVAEQDRRLGGDKGGSGPQRP